MQYDIYVVMYRPPFADKYFPILAFKTLESADAYIKDNDGIGRAYYVDLINYSEN